MSPGMGNVSSTITLTGNVAHVADRGAVVATRPGWCCRCWKVRKPVSRSPGPSFDPRSSVSDVMAMSAMRWSAVPRLSEVRLATFWTLDGGARGDQRVQGERARLTPREGEPAGPAPRDEHLGAEASATVRVRVTVGATLNPELVPLIGLAGLNGSSRSRPGGRQSVIVGLTRSPAEVAGTATPTSHDAVLPGTVTSDVVMILLNSTLTGTIVWVVQRLMLMVPSR